MAEYEICQRRGHEARSGESTMGGWARCRWCGIQFRFVTTLEEREWGEEVDRGPEPGGVEADKPNQARERGEQ